MVMNLR